RDRALLPGSGAAGELGPNRGGAGQPGKPALVRGHARLPRWPLSAAGIDAAPLPGGAAYQVAGRLKTTPSSLDAAVREPGHRPGSAGLHPVAPRAGRPDTTGVVRPCRQAEALSRAGVDHGGLPRSGRAEHLLADAAQTDGDGTGLACPFAAVGVRAG